MVKTSVIYGVVTVSPNGGQRMNSFLEWDSAQKEAAETVEAAKAAGWGGKVLLSELDYDLRNNRIISSGIINEDSELLYVGGER